MTTFLNTNIPDPVAFELFGISIMWYGVLIAFGMFLAGVVIYRRAPKHDMESEKTLNIFIICVLSGVVGARLYYVLFNWSMYSGDFMMIVNLRLGGLAIHGGLIFGFLAGMIYCRTKGTGVLNTFDLFAPGVALAQSVGRWGNYFNSEAHGGPTDLPWAILVDGRLVHPTFLYASLWCFALFLALIFVDNRRIFDGQTFLCYAALYSFGRFFIEHLRTDSLMLGMFKQAQVVSVVAFVASIIAYVALYRDKKSKGRIFY